jgi:hypothetical protein
MSQSLHLDRVPTGPGPTADSTDHEPRTYQNYQRFFDVELIDESWDSQFYTTE